MDHREPGADSLTVRNPRTGKRDYTITPPDNLSLDALCRAAREAQPAWQALGAEGRVAALKQLAAAMGAEKDAVTDALFADTGRLRETMIEFDGVIDIIHRWAEMGPGELQPYRDRSTAIPFLTLDGNLPPYPLVGVISPWNFPLLLSLLDAIPALIAGSAVIIKPSEITPRFAGAMRHVLESVPELNGILTYIDGDGETGQALIDRVDMVVFTGSVATGRKVAVQAAQNFIPCFLELGGKDAAVLLPGTDIEKAAAGLAWGSTTNHGAACQSIERIYVDRSIHDAFLTALIPQVESIRFAFPDPADGHLGPIIFDKQAAIIQAHLDDALAKGAKVLTGGSIETLGGGLYCQPTVLTNVDHSMRLMQDETFGPILPVMPFDSEAEAIRLANDTSYGLSGSVWGGDLEQCRRVAAAMQAGAISINDTTLTAVMWEGENQAFGLSGMGQSRMGPASIRRFVRTQLNIVNQGGPPLNPWWFAAQG